MEYIGWPVALAVVLFVASHYIHSARTIAQTFHFRYPTEIVVFDPAGVSLPNEWDEFIAPVKNALSRLGFEDAGYFALPGALSNVKTINLMMVNPGTFESALVNCIYVDEVGVCELQNRHVEFLTRFRDGVCLQTNNSWQIGAFAQEPNDLVVQFWDVDDPAELHRRHQQISGRLSATPRWIRLLEEFHGNVEAYVDRVVLEESLEYQVRVGLLRRVPDGYVTTGKGACLIAWQQQFPLQNIRRARARWRAERWLTAITE